VWHHVLHELGSEDRSRPAFRTTLVLHKLPQYGETCLSARLFGRLWMRLLRREVGSQHNVLEANLRAGLDPGLGSAAVRY
jgi:hypothetical protein